ncbi:hypothetical protein GX411_05910 [Candidatus Fermentibacteria bacterium]|nr:hypothetical protein [Candidatus Fermentibacteria bacterium]
MSHTAVLSLISRAAEGGGSGGGLLLGLEGMLVVFAGLVLLALFLPALRKMLERTTEPEAAQQPRGETTPVPPSDEEIAAVVCALHSHLAQIEQMERLHLTWGMYDKPYKPWRLAGRAEFMMGRQGVQARPRKRS